jgi:hypothetical protein
MSVKGFTRFPRGRWRPLIAVVVCAAVSAAAILVWAGRAQLDGAAPTTVDPAGEYRPIPAGQASMPAALVLRGTGSQAVPFAAPLDHARTARLAHEGDGRFVVDAIVPGRPAQQLVAANGRYDGSADVTAGPDAPVEGLSIEASGPWTVMIG